MRVILDTHVLLGARTSLHGPLDAIYRAWRGASFELVTSATQLEELRRVSRHPTPKTIQPSHRIGAMVNILQRAIVMAQRPPLPDGIEANDPDDTFLLAMAPGSKADPLVRGGRHDDEERPRTKQPVRSRPAPVNRSVARAFQ